mgnify:CR=1 FL=1|tara:strand:+ start:622 stop:1353 length:732 start_codon:yes stop_codon:yes gene_type:complete
MRDSQRQKCYTWENSQPWMSKKGGELTLEQAEYIVTKLNPKMYVVKGKEGCTAYCHRTYISLPTWALTWSVVLHELAHSFTPDSHGPKFMGCFVYLIHKFHPMHPSLAELSVSMNEAKLNFTGIHNWEKRFNRLTLNVETVSQKTKPLSWERATEISVIAPPKRVSSVKIKFTNFIRANDHLSLYSFNQVETLLNNYNNKFSDKLTVSDVKYFITREFLKAREMVNPFSPKVQHRAQRAKRKV